MTGIVWQRRRAAVSSTWREFTRDRGGVVGLVVLGVVVVLAVLAPLVTDAAGLDVTKAAGQRWQPPSGDFWFGTDHTGRSVLLLTWWGSRISLLIGLTATVLSVAIGTLVGVTAAHFGGSLSALAPFGRLVTYGMAARQETSAVPPGALMQRSRAVIGFWLAHCMTRPEMMDAAMNDLLPMVAEGALKPVVGGRYPLSAVREAHQDLLARRSTGKLVLDPRR